MTGTLTKVWIVIFLGLSALTLTAEEKVLEGVMKPSMIDVANGKLFVVDGEQIKIFSLNSLQLLKKFGRKGEGPGEYKIMYGYPLRVVVIDNRILVESRDKLLFYTPEGEYRVEIRKANNLSRSRVELIGNRFVVRKIFQNPQVSMQSYSAVFIMDQQFNEIMELVRQPFVQQGGGSDTRINMEQDFLYFHVWKDKIYIEESQNGFVISVWDTDGRLIYKIKHDLPKTKVTSGRRNQLIEDFKTDPFVIPQIKQDRGWN